MPARPLSRRTTKAFRLAVLPRWGIVALVIVTIGFGGAAQFGLLSDIPVRLAALAGLAAMILSGRLVDARPSRLERIICLGIVATPLVQLVPLPPAFWQMFPERRSLLGVYQVAGIAPPWLPISLDPDRTIDALFFLLVPAAFFLLGKALDRNGRRLCLVAILGMIGLGALVGVMQMAGGPSSPFRLYQIANADGPIGLFANRNHFALFLALAMPIGGRLAIDADNQRAVWIGWVAAALALMMLIVATQSRAGILLGLSSMLLTPLLFLDWRRARYAVVVIGLAAVLAGLALSQGPIGDRFARLEHDNPRADILGSFVGVAARNMPVGTGIGSFDRTYRRYETVQELGPSYWNHAHNDPVQLAIEAGVPGLALLALFAIWWGRLALLCWPGAGTPTDRASLRLAMAATGLILVHSIVDYPLRTPALAAMFALMCGIAARKGVRQISR